MPKLLLQRLKQHNSVVEFQTASRQRFADALALKAAGMRTGAVYLFGYVVEMRLKAACFALDGFGRHQPIRRKDLDNAKRRALQLGAIWSGNWHDIMGWAEYLVLLRRISPALQLNPQHELLTLSHAQHVSRRWNEALRYHSNRAYNFEVDTVEMSAEWFLKHLHES